MKKIFYVALSAIILVVGNSYCQDKKSEQVSDSVQNERLKGNLIKFYNKFLSYQKTSEYKLIIKMGNAPKQEDAMKSKVDSIAKLSGFKNATDFFDTEEQMRRDPKIKQYSDRIAKIAKAVEADTAQATPVDSNIIKETTKKLIQFYTELDKWSNTNEFKALKELNDKKKIQDAIKNKENEVSKLISQDVAGKFMFLEMKYRIRDKALLDIKQKYKTAVSLIMPKEEKKDIPKPERPKKVEKPANTEKTVTPEFKTK
jgi:hypothetical protein